MTPKELYEAIDLLDVWATCFDYKRYIAGNVEEQVQAACDKLRDFITETANKSRVS